LILLFNQNGSHADRENLVLDPSGEFCLAGVMSGAFV